MPIKDSNLANSITGYDLVNGYMGGNSLGGYNPFIGLSSKVKGLFGSNLIGYWALDESPSGNDYLTFNGSSTSVNFGSGASVDDLHAGEFTVDMWVRPNGAQTDPISMLINKGYSSSGGWRFYMTSSTIVGYIEYTTGSSLVASNAISNNLFDGNWHHVAIYFNPFGDGKAKMSVDGNWYGSSTSVSGSPISDAGLDGYIGRRSSNASYYFDGDIGWTRISNNNRLNFGVSFTPPSRTTIPTSDANTVLLLPMNEGYGSVAGDLSSNNNDGVITDGDWGAYPVARDSSGNGYHGEYVGVRLADLSSGVGGKMPYFDGVNDYVDLYSTDFVSAFNGEEGAVGLILNSTSGLLDGSRADYLFNFRVDGNNFIYANFPTAPNRLDVVYKAGGVQETIVNTGLVETGLVMFLVSWSKSGDYIKPYWQGSVLPVIGGTLGTWVGAPTITSTVIGAFSTGLTGAGRLHEGHVFLLGRPAISSEALQLAQWAGVA